MSVAEHYQRAQLADRLIARLAEHGITEDSVTPGDLEALDQMHVRGGEAVGDLARLLGVEPGMTVLDLGAGIGGPARVLAARFGARVIALDLTPDLCEASRRLNALVGLDDRITVIEGDATDTGLDAESVDRVVTVHACMNIPDKAGVYAEAYGCLKPGGRFAFYDVVRGPAAAMDGDIHFPVPWASRAEISHLMPLEAMVDLAEEAGFRTVEAIDLSAAAKARIAEQRAQAQRRKEAGDRPPLQAGDILMGDTAAEKQRNLRRNLEDDRITLAMAVFEKPV